MSQESQLPSQWTAGVMPRVGYWSGAAISPAGYALVANQLTTEMLRVPNTGPNWITYTLPGSYAWRKMATNGNRMVILAGDSGKGAWSRDGVTWYNVTIPAGPQGAGHWGDVVSDGSTFLSVVAGTDSRYLDYIAFSVDGATFSPVPVSQGAYWRLSASANRSEYMLADPVSGYTVLTKDINARGGSGSWVRHTLPESENWTDISHGPAGEYIIVGSPAGGISNKYALFKNGSWTSRRFPVGGSWGRVYYHNGLYIVLPRSGNVSLLSTDGEVWQSATLPRSGNWSAVVGNDNDRFYAFCFGTNVMAHIDV